MGDWRWITQVSARIGAGGGLPPTENGMWLDFEGVEMIMPLPPGRIPGARTRLGWLTAHGWHFIFVAEQISPFDERSEQQPTTHERTTNADSALEPTQEP
jgi:hypothetical protein